MNYMKTSILLLALSVLIALPASGQTTAEALEYMNNIGSTLEETKGETWRYLKAVTRGKSARKVDSKRQKLAQELREVKLEVRKFGPFQGDDELRQATMNYLDLTYLVINEDYDKLMNLEEIAEQSYDAMEAYLLAQEIASEKLDSAFAILDTAQYSFADKYGVNLIESEGDRQSKKIAKAARAISYYNDVYLIFFKVYKQEQYVMEALQKDDVLSLEQNTQALMSLADEALLKLNELESYNNDGQLKIAAKRIIDFYNRESKNDFPQIVDFYLKKDNFEKLSAAMEAKKKKDITQEDVDNYNRAVEDYNGMIGKFNSINERGNDAREEAIEKWNQGVEDFFDKHA